MAASQPRARIFSMTWRTDRRSRESTGQISDGRALLATRSTQRGCVSQTIGEAGKESRRAATAGKVCTMSPREPRRTTRKRRSAMQPLSDRFEKPACGVILRIADDGHANTEAARDFAFGDRVGGVVGAFGVDIRTQLLKQRFDRRLRKEDHIVDVAQSGDQLGTGELVEDRTAGPLELARTGVGIDGHDQNVALVFGSGQIAHVADVKRVKATVGQHNALPCPFQTDDFVGGLFAREDLGVGGTHDYDGTPEAALWISSNSSLREPVAVPRFMTTRPPAMLAICAASRGDAPQARASVYAASTVSPAPVTSTAS